MYIINIFADTFGKETKQKALLKKCGFLRCIPQESAKPSSSFKLVSGSIIITGSVVCSPDQTYLIISNIPKKLNRPKPLAFSLAKYGALRKVEYQYLGHDNFALVDYFEPTSAVMCFTGDNSIARCSIIEVHWLKALTIEESVDYFGKLPVRRAIKVPQHMGTLIRGSKRLLKHTDLKRLEGVKQRDIKIDRSKLKRFRYRRDSSETGTAPTIRPVIECVSMQRTDVSDQFFCHRERDQEQSIMNLRDRD